MEYVKPFGQFIEFDNSDIIVTSDNEFPRTEREGCRGKPHGVWCSNNGNPDKPNQCGLDGFVDCSSITSYSDWLDCRWTAITCDPTNGNFNNSIPGRPSK